MKIAIEAQRIFRSKKHGMDFVALETIRQLQRIDKVNEYRIYVAPGDDCCLEESSNFRIETLKCSSYYHFEQRALPRALSLWCPDVLHCTSNTAPLRLRGVGRLIITLHDVIFMENFATSQMSLYQRLGRLYRRYVVPRVVPRADRIITVSQYERDVICAQLGLCPMKIDVVYNGFGSHFKPTPPDVETRKRYSLPERYIFFLGNTDAKKNTPDTIRGYARYVAQAEESALPLVVADLSRETLARLVEPEIWNRIAHLVLTPGYIRNADLPQIYSGARILLYLSLRESFGIPLLEAMACHTPVLSSTTSAIPEIAGDGAMLIDPTDITAIAEGIRRLSTDEQLRQWYISHGVVNATRFSWMYTAQDTLKIYENGKL